MSETNLPERKASTASEAAGPTVGHVHLRVADLARGVAFYTEVIGLEVQAYYKGTSAFLSSNGYHHHIALNTWDSLGASPPPPGHTGLYHTAFLYPDRASLAAALRRVMAAGIEVTGAYDHGFSQSVYFNDPDGNGVEIYYDRAPEEWLRDEAGRLVICGDPFELDTLLSDAPQP